MNFDIRVIRFLFAPTSFLVDLLFTVCSPVTFVAHALVLIYTIYTLSIDTRTGLALIYVNVAMWSRESRDAVAVVHSLARLAVQEVRTVCGAHGQG